MPLAQRSSLLSLMLQISILTTTVSVSVQDCNVAATGSSSTSILPVPLHSTVHLNCTLQSSSRPLWSIDLPDDSTSGRFQFDTQRRRLNAHGLYELPSITEAGMTTLRLLVNNSTINNRTLIDCVGGPGESILTRLIVFEPSESHLLVAEEKVNSVNLTWSQESSLHLLADVVQSFFLTISHGSSSQVISLNESSYNFTAPEGAPPCEVYNFSVTATYDIDGATYTGAGCSVPSPVLSRMLPSLPNIDRVESSLQYSLVKQDKEGITLRLSVEEANYCEQYPVINYTVVTNSPLFGELMHSVSPQMDNYIMMQEDVIYNFKINVANAVGVVSSKNSTQFYTTDVQMVSVHAVPVENQNTFMVRCHFMEGSDAQGCMVVIQSTYKNETVNITRKYHVDDIAEVKVNVAEPTSCYHGVYAFDIEYNGSVGTLAVPGQLVKDSSKEERLCTTHYPKTGRQSTTIAVVLSVVLLIMITVLVVLVAVVVTKFKTCRFCRHNISDLLGGGEENGKQREDIQLHHSSDNVRKFGDGGGDGTLPNYDLAAPDQLNSSTSTNKS